MTKEKTIHILDRDVRLRYCAATENGFEQLRSKSVTDLDFHLNEDMIALSLSAIIAAYARTDEEPPVSSNDLLYDASPKDIITLMTTVVELRNEWYGVPKVVEETLASEQSDDQPADGEKNA